MKLLILLGIVMTGVTLISLTARTLTGRQVPINEAGLCFSAMLLVGGFITSWMN